VIPVPLAFWAFSSNPSGTSTVILRAVSMPVILPYETPVSNMASQPKNQAIRTVRRIKISRFPALSAGQSKDPASERRSYEPKKLFVLKANPHAAW
jgi:hypothetical protein